LFSVSLNHVVETPIYCPRIFPSVIQEIRDLWLQSENDHTSEKSCAAVMQ